MEYKLSNDWDSIKEIVIYGFGRVCQRIYPKLRNDFKIKYIVDNDMQLTEYDGVKIYKINDIAKDILNHKIVITTSQKIYEEIREDLEKLGAKEYSDFCRGEDFIIEWYWRNKKEICIPQVTAALTSRCTFNCKNCVSLMPYFNESFDYSTEDILRDLESLFHYVDYIASYYLVGGEPLLSPILADVISSVYQKYEKKIGLLQIITNGSVVPDEKLLSVLKAYNVQVRVSNYTKTIKYETKFNQVIEALKQNGINYSIGDYKEWVDIGFPATTVDFGTDIEVLNNHTKACSTGCHALNDGKLYYCGTLFFAEKSELFTLKEDDYIDLRIEENWTNKESLQQLKYNIMEYCRAERKGKYLSLCRYCRGCGADNTHICQVAEQKKR